MNDTSVRQLVDTFFGFQHREMNLLEWKYEGGGTIVVKLEDMGDGLIGIYTIELNFQGFAQSLEKGNFEIEE
jgi:hypothetical protein